MLKCVKTEGAPAAIGPYSQGVTAGNLVFVSGQLPIDPDTGVFAGDSIAEQTRQSLENVRQVLSAAGSSMEQVLKTTVFLKNMADFPEMNQVYSSFFQGQVLPARAAVEVSALPKGALVEIEVIAEK